MTSDIAKYNLERDKNVLGKDWLLTYGSYFADEENIQIFIDAVRPYLPNKPLDTLYVASASGLLGERLIEALGQGSLTIVDISKEHLASNANPQTIKIEADLLKLDLNKQFDLIIMRSSLDYFPSKELQVEVLKKIKNHLKADGIFINQPAYISNINDRNILSQAYNSNDKIGKRFFQSSDINDIYQASGFSTPTKIGDGKEMIITEQDHTQRYGLNTDDIKNIQNILKEAKNNAEVTPSGYTLKFEFPIFICVLK